jgi:hypothetical protein
MVQHDARGDHVRSQFGWKIRNGITAARLTVYTGTVIAYKDVTARRGHPKKEKNHGSEEKEHQVPQEGQKAAAHQVTNRKPGIIASRPIIRRRSTGISPLGATVRAAIQMKERTMASKKATTKLKKAKTLQHTKPLRRK